MDPLGIGSGSLEIRRAHFGTPALDRIPSNFILEIFKKSVEKIQI